MNARGYSKLLLLLCGVAGQASAAINFGSRESGFVVSGGTLDLGSGAALTDGSLRDTGGTLTASGAVCSGLTVESKDGTAVKKMLLDGTVTLGTALSLGNNQKLLVSGGSVTEAVTAAGAAATPSLIEGFGQFASAITVADDKQLNLRWSGSLNTNILLNASNAKTSTLRLEQDLLFAPGCAVTASDTSGATNKIDFNGYRLSMGGDETAATSIANAQMWKNANVLLTGPVTVAASKTVTLNTSAAYIAGNGNRLAFSAGSVLANGGNAVTFDDIILGGLTAASLAGAGDWTFINTRLEDSSNALLIDGTITSATVDVFGGDATFGDNTRITLLKDIMPAGVWTAGGSLTINGNGNRFNCGGASGCLALAAASSLYLENIILTQAVGNSFDTSAATNVYLSDVVFAANSGNAVRVLGSGLVADAQEPALACFSAVASSGDIFTTSVSWQTGVHLELLNDVTLSATWTFEDDAIIDGNGYALNVEDGILAIAAGKTLKLRNVCLDNITSGSLSVGGASSAVSFANVTVRLSGTVDWSTGINTVVSVDGPLTVVTGPYTWTVKSGSALNGFTAYYDTLTWADNNNLAGFTTGSGRTYCIAPPLSGTVSITMTTDLTHNEYLFPNPDDGSLPGRALSFSGDGSIIYVGHGRSLFFPYTNPDMTNTAVLSVAGETVVKTVDMCLEGLAPEHLNIGADAALLFCDNTLIRLHTDWVLDKPLTFGSDPAAGAEIMTLDLNGHTVDLSHAAAAISLQGADGCMLRIRNGRLVNLSSTKLSATEGAKLILENVELALSVASSGNYTFADASLDIEGRCVISGLHGNIFDNTSTAAVTIKPNSSLVVQDGLVYSHHNTGVDNFIMSDNSARLELIGATFRRPASVATDPLVLTCGTLVVDHKSYIQPGADGVWFGDGADAANNLYIEIRPGATINITTDGSSTGTVTLANV